MLGKRKSTTTKKFNAQYRCSHCESEIKEVQEEAFLRVFFVDLFRLTNWEYLECTSCEKMVYKKELIKLPAREERVEKFDDGSKRKTIIERNHSGTTTRTIDDYSEQYPQVENDLLLAKSIFAIMTFMPRLDNSLDYENSEAFQDLHRYFGQYKNQIDQSTNQLNKLDLDDAKKEIVALFLECKNVFGEKALNFILSRNLSLTANQMILNPKVDLFFKDLLNVMEIPSLRADAYIMDLRF